MKAAIKIVDNAFVLDNSDAENPFIVLCKKSSDKIDFLFKDIPSWLAELFQDEESK